MKQKLFISYYIRLFITQYLANEKGLSENTILAYRDCLKLFLYYCDKELKMDIDKIECDKITNDIVINFLDWLENTRNCTGNTRNARLAAIKTFFYYLGRCMPECLENSRKIMLIQPKKIPHKTAEYLEDNELKAIINSVNIESVNGIRDKALLLLMYNTGARVQEIIDITTSDLRLDAASQVKLMGKGKKQRICPLWKETVEAINLYLNVRNPKVSNEKYLFLNAQGNKITRFGIRYIIKKYTQKAIKVEPALDKKSVSPHTFRHTTAMHLLQSGNELNMVRLWLGHASLNTTHMYVEINLKMKKEILNKCNPPVLKEKKKVWKNPKILEWLDSITANNKSKLCEVKY